MEKKDRFTIKFAIVALGLGVLSPSIDIGSAMLTKNTVNTHIASTYINITLFNEAEARPVHRQTRRVARRTSRRTSRRVSHRHNAYGGGRYYGSNYRRNTGAAVAAGVVTGVVVGSAIASSNNNRY